MELSGPQYNNANMRFSKAIMLFFSGNIGIFEKRVSAIMNDRRVTGISHGAP
jgi:hypothetical protein